MATAADLQVPLQPLVLPEEKLLAKLQVEVDLGGEGDDVGRPQVPAGKEHTLLLNNDSKRCTQHNATLTLS